MALLTLRNVKGSPLTNQEADDNLSALNTELGTKQATLVSGNNIKTINNTSILGSGDITISGGGGSSLIPTAVKTSAYTASANDLVRCDTTSGGFSVTLPASPADGTTIDILDMTNGFATNNLTVLPNTGKTIESDDFLSLDINGTYVSFVYNSISTNWRLLETPSVPLASNTALVNTGAASNISGILLGNGTTLSGVAPNTSGNVLTSNGTTWVSSPAPVSLPTQTDHANKYLKTDGTTATWETLSTTLQVLNRSASVISVSVASGILSVLNRSGTTIPVGVS